MQCGGVRRGRGGREQHGQRAALAGREAEAVGAALGARRLQREPLAYYMTTDLDLLVRRIPQTELLSSAAHPRHAAVSRLYRKYFRLIRTTG